jgi:hypothetical protein
LYRSSQRESRRWRRSTSGKATIWEMTRSEEEKTQGE